MFFSATPQKRSIEKNSPLKFHFDRIPGSGAAGNLKSDKNEKLIITYFCTYVVFVKGAMYYKIMFCYLESTFRARHVFSIKTKKCMLIEK